jgi:hypothetical protein
MAHNWRLTFRETCFHTKMHALPPQSLRQRARGSKRIHSPYRDAGLQAIPKRVLLAVVYADAHNLINEKRGKEKTKRQ